MPGANSPDSLSPTAGGRLYNFVDAEKVSYSFSSQELAAGNFDLPILERLNDAKILSSKLYGQLKLAFQEALANALEHGNLELASGWREEIDSKGYDRFSKTKAERLNISPYSGRKVYICSEYSNGILSITIRDEGPGFSPPDLSLVQPPPPDIELNSFGRGLPILIAVLDSVTYNKSGNEINLIKKIR